MEQASACHFGMVPWVATLATLVGISHSSAIRCMTKTENHRSRQQGKAKTTKKHGQTTLEGKTVDFSAFRCIKESLQIRFRLHQTITTTSALHCKCARTQVATELHLGLSRVVRERTPLLKPPHCSMLPSSSLCLAA